MFSLLLALVVPAQASTRVVLTPGDQPMSDEIVLVSRLGAVCGAHLASEAELSDLVETYEECDVVVRDNGFTVRRIRDRVESRTAPLGDGELAAVQQADLRILLDLGFDEEEFDNVVTSEVGARDMVEGESPTAARYIASKTFVDRSFEGAAVGGSRVVVTRNAEGELVGINAIWPNVETGAVLTITDDEIASVDDVAADAVPGSLRAVRRVLVPVFDSEGILISGTVLTEITFSVYRNEPKLKTLYLLDGDQVNPLQLEE